MTSVKRTRDASCSVAIYEICRYTIRASGGTAQISRFSAAVLAPGTRTAGEHT